MKSRNEDIKKKARGLAVIRMYRSNRRTDLTERKDLSLVYELFEDTMKEIFVDYANVEGRTQFQLVMPFASDLRLISYQGSFAKLPLMIVVHL